MGSLADDRVRARALGACGRETVLTQFDPLVHAERLSDLLTDLHLGRSAQPDISSASFPGEARREA